MRGFELRCSASSSIKTHIPLSLLCHLIKGTRASFFPFNPKCSAFLSLDMNILCWTQMAFYLNCVFKQKLHCFHLVSNFLRIDGHLLAFHQKQYFPQKNIYIFDHWKPILLQKSDIFPGKNVILLYLKRMKDK